MGSQVIGHRYFMALSMGICRGPVDEVVQIRVGNIRAWPFPDQKLPKADPLWVILRDALQAQGGNARPGEVSTIAEGPGGVAIAHFDGGARVTIDAEHIKTALESGEYAVNAADLFGGDEKEGGIEGTLLYADGNHEQNVTAEYMAKGMEGRIPGYRGVASLLFDGLICAINPYPKPWSFRVRRTIRGWDGETWFPETATIWMWHNMVKAMNPIHILYECFTNKSWGRGYPRETLDETTWRRAAQTLFDDNFGLCLKYARQTKLSDFISSVKDHIGASIYTDRETGLISIDLIRDDYVVSELPMFSYGSGLLSITSDEAVSQDSLINEVIVKWYDPIAQSERETRAHNLALQQGQAGKNTTTREYPGIPTHILAGRVAERDLRAASTPLRRYNIELDRRAWRLVPGSVFRISAGDRNLDEIVLRAGAVDHRDASGKIKVVAVADVFSTPRNSYLEQPPSELVLPDRTLTEASRRRLTEATYADLYVSVDRANLKELDPDSGIIATFASRPTNLSLRYNVLARAQGQSGFPNSGQGVFAPSVVITGSLGESTTELSFTGAVDAGLIRVGWAVLIEDEICRLDAITMMTATTGTMTIARGSIDTIPATHPAGATAFIYRLGSQGSDDQEYARTEVVEAGMQTITSSGTLDLDDMPVDSLTITARYMRPYPPANVRVNGASILDNVPSVTGAMSLTWNHRNRKLIKDTLLAHDQSGVGIEVGTTYHARIFTGGVLRGSYDNIASPWSYTSGMRSSDGVSGTARIEFFSRRDGLDSHQRYSFNVSF